MEPSKTEEERERITKILNERLEIHDDSRKAAQEKLHDFCDGLRAQINAFEEKVNSELEEKFTTEDNRLQTALNGLRSSESESDISKMIRRAKTELLVAQTYEVTTWNPDEESMWRKRNTEERRSAFDFSSLCELKTERKAEFEILSERKPTHVTPSFTKKGEFSLSFTFFSADEVEVLKGVDSPFKVEVKVWERGQEEETSRALTKELSLENDEGICFKDAFLASIIYTLKMRIIYQGMSTKWSDEVEFTTPEFKEYCVWKECPDNVYGNMKYSVDKENPRNATSIGDDCTIIGSTSLPRNQVTSWSIKILKSKKNNGGGIYIGIAPSDINQNGYYNYTKCGWYFDCYDSNLCSGPPHNYKWKKYGPRKERGQYLHTGDSACVVMDATNGKLSFVLNGVNLGIAYEGIPLDKPLVPCVLLKNECDSIELII